MRRGVAPAMLLKGQFLEVQSLVGKTLEKDGSRDVFLDAISEKIASLQEIAIYYCSDPEELDPKKLAAWVESASKERADRFARKHIIEGLDLYEIFSDRNAVAEAAISALAALNTDGDLDTQIRDAARSVCLELPESDRSFNNQWRLESLMRGSIGLDGRVPDWEIDRDMVQMNARQILSLLADPECAPNIEENSEGGMAPV